MFDGVQSVFFFVFDVVEAANWYSKLLNLPVKYFNSDGKIKAAIIQVGRVETFFHPADAKMSPGSAGQVAYWRVNDFAKALDKANQHGATLYRGPLVIEDNRAICQMRDPFNNLFGMQGSLHSNQNSYF